MDGHGRTTLTGTDANRRARERFVDRLEQAGLDVRIDAVGNIVGRWVPEGVDPSTAPVATGSHLDSVPVGGIFDGPLGVYGGLEAVRAIQESDRTPERPIDVVCFTEEEGQRFGNGLLGSSVATGQRSVDDALAFEADDGTTLADALDEIGFRGEGRIDAAEWDAWLELHPEQGTRLEEENATAGIVTNVTGITHCYLEVNGEADHAGSTPMPGRADALAAASEVVLDVEEAAKQLVDDESPSAVGTVGKAVVEPNATNVIPGQVRLGIDIRDVSADSISMLVDALEDSAQRVERERAVETTVSRPYDVPPEPMADRCRETLVDAGTATGLNTLLMHSGAAHDTMNVARVTDAGLLFAPSRDGISHNPREWTEWSDCAGATTVLAEGLARLAES
ncbi:amidase, hydantoinase/carbamoylase family protein [Natronorubrum bangense JCM 10635]|uniref:Amidase, hydantoinase/carbamoylase family protein n=1 Tax=Natronorubrum bangense JCM 10635 TaxID=1227500 RepID=L9WPB4_9EURY|nr:amidase, hydantoinase/carbamoylase family protein [Natronorubrum bangense JCM 10635]